MLPDGICTQCRCFTNRRRDAWIQVRSGRPSAGRMPSRYGLCAGADPVSIAVMWRTQQAA